MTYPSSSATGSSPEGAAHSDTPVPGPHQMPRSRTEFPGPTGSTPAGTTPVRPDSGGVDSAGVESIAESDDPDLAASVTSTVRELLAQVDDVREQAGEAFDLVALARQSELLERAHDTLTAALAEVDRR